MVDSDGALVAAPGESDNGDEPQKHPIWLGLLALVVGAAFVMVAFLLARNELRYGDEGRLTQATIVRMWVDEADDDEGSDTYHVGYEFFAGGTYRGSGEVGLFRYSQLAIGDRIDASYLTSEPGENRLGTPEPQLMLPLAIAAFGGLALIAAPLLLASSMMARRARPTGALAPDAGADLERVDIFTRSPIHAAGGPLAFVAGAAFLAVAMFGVGQAGNMPSLLMLALLCSVIGIALVVGGITAVRRGFGRKLAEVGPNGLWLLGLGRVGWRELAEVRIERSRRDARRDDDEAAVTRSTWATTRLGIVPSDPALQARRPDRLSRSLGRPFFGFLNLIQSNARLVTESDQAPFGVSAYEMDQSLAELVASVRRFTPVTMREVKPMGETEQPPSAPPQQAPGAPVTDAELRELDAQLARPAERATTFVDQG